MGVRGLTAVLDKCPLAWDLLTLKPPVLIPAFPILSLVFSFSALRQEKHVFSPGRAFSPGGASRSRDALGATLTRHQRASSHEIERINAGLKAFQKMICERNGAAVHA